MSDAIQDPWPFELVARERWERLTERQKGWVEGAILAELRAIEPRAPRLQLIRGNGRQGKASPRPALRLV